MGLIAESNRSDWKICQFFLDFEVIDRMNVRNTSLSPVYSAPIPNIGAVKSQKPEYFIWMTVLKLSRSFDCRREVQTCSLKECKGP